MTEGYSGAQIENLLNEAMLNALCIDRYVFTMDDFDLVLNKMLVEPIEHWLLLDMNDRISIHEMGHAIVGLLSKHHSKMSKVVINLSSQKMSRYTVFETALNPLNQQNYIDFDTEEGGD